MKTEQFFRCLADNLRLKMVLLLWQEGELSTVAIAQILGVNESPIKRQMALLNKNQIVLIRQKDLFQFCQINKDLPVWAQKILKHTHRGNKQLLEEVLSKRNRSDSGGARSPDQGKSDTLI